MNGVSPFEKGWGGGGGVEGLDYLQFGRQTVCLLCAGSVGQKTISPATCSKTILDTV